MNDHQKALLIVAALIFGSGNTTGFVGGRVTAPVPRPEVRIVHLRSASIAKAVPAPATEPVSVSSAPAAEQAAPAPSEPAAPIIEVKPPPMPTPRPKVETKSIKPQSRPAARPVRKPTASECAQLKLGMLTIGKDGVITKAKTRGYTASQVTWAIAACGL